MQIMDRILKSTKKFGIYLEILGEQGLLSEDKRGRRTYGVTKPNGNYEVALPHSCDQWSIATGDKDQCITELEVFIAEANEILERLKKI